MAKTIKLYQVDAFTTEIFRGNPAAVCILENWLPDQTMQAIAAENNLAETAFAVKVGENYHLRWFTPAVEVDLCGHATLATAHVLFTYYGYNSRIINFTTQTSGLLTVERDGENLILDFPVDRLKKIEIPSGIESALGKTPLEAYSGKSDYLFIFSSQKEIEEIVPDFNAISKLDCRGMIISAPGDTVDFVSRFFGPQVGVNEDPVTGSAHTTLTPYWAKKLGKKILNARQLSNRKGDLTCEFLGERIKITGQAVTYLQGEIHIK